jgi:Hexokinase
MYNSSSAPTETSRLSDLSWLPFTESWRTRRKLSNRPRVPLLYPLAAVGLFLFLAVQFIFFTSRDASAPPTNTTRKPIQTYSPFGDSVYRQEAYYDQLAPGKQCRPKNPLSAKLPFSYDPVNMARRESLADEVTQLASLFDYSAEDVNKGVKAFLQQMEEGLEKQGTMMAQIPTYVTSVPNGTEKVPSLP